jgi:hypothetical protein
MVINTMKLGWIQYAKSYEGECNNQALGPWRAKEVPYNVGALLPRCFCNSVMPPVINLLSLLYQSIFLLFLLPIRMPLAFSDMNKCLSLCKNSTLDPRKLSPT